MSFMRNLRLVRAPNRAPNTDSEHSGLGVMPTRIIRSDGFYDTFPPFAFSPGGRFMTTKSGGYRERTVTLSQVADGRKMGSIVTDHYVVSIVLSKDGKWVVLGEQPYPKSRDQDALATVWDMQTLKKVTEIKYGEPHWNGQLVERAADASPDSTRFAMSSKMGVSLCVWSITTGKRLLGPLRFGNSKKLYAKHVKFSPRGDRLAVAVARPAAHSPGHFYIYDSQTGDLLINLPEVDVFSFAWFSDNKRVCAVVGDKFRCIDMSVVRPSFTDFELEMSSTYIALDSQNRFLVSLRKDCSIAFWDTYTLTQIGPTLAHRADAKLSSICLSDDNAYLAGIVGGRKRTITIWSLQEILPPFYFMKQIPLFRVSEAAFVPWVQNNLSITDATLSDEIRHSPNHEALANRALVRTRLCQWREAREDAERSLAIHPSFAAHIAKLLILIGQGEYNSEMGEFELVSCDNNSSEHELLELIKCIVTFVSGRHSIAISHINDLANNANDKGLHHLIEVKMYDLQGDTSMSQGDFHGALQSFKQATQLYLKTRPSTMYHETPVLHALSLIFGWQFEHLGMVVQQHQSEALLAIGRVEDAVESLQLIVTKISHGEIGTDQKVLDWVSGFKQQCASSFETLGDKAFHAENIHEALRQYSSGLSLEPPSPHGLFVKRSKARVIIGSWKQAFEDADKAVARDPLSPWGYERKLTALYGLHRYDEAIDALDEMLSRLKSSSDPQSCCLRKKGVDPPQIASIISTYVTENLRHSPLVLICTETGRLCDKSARARAFHAYPQYKDLILSPPSQIDHETIKQIVTEYFRYTTLSHTWEEGEPLFHSVLPLSVYDLPKSPTNAKLQQFCLTSRDAGFNWSWSDTCCVDKTDGPVLQESLTSMYQWYHDSSLTLVHLKGIPSPLGTRSDLDAFLDALVHCTWNTRAWTLQEYFASTVIRFYTEDWKPYLRDINVSNDKAHPTVMRQMALATGVEARVLSSLRPGSDNVREKLRLASNRIATRQEDNAYSLFGILGVSIPAIYGEGHKALGRLLEAVLYRSGDATILAWTGQASEHNSCLPAEITVYAEDLSSFVPSPIEYDQMATMISAIQLSSMHQESAIRLYDRVVHLPSPRLVSSRLSLSCIAFPITPPEDISTRGDSTDGPARHYTTMASALGKVEIETTDALAGLENLVLVHPWLDSFLDPIFTSPRPNDDPNSHSGQLSKLARALRLLIRLRQPFGALLLAPLNLREFKRVATDHLIRVQVRDDVSLEKLLEMVNVDVLDIL